MGIASLKGSLYKQNGETVFALGDDQSISNGNLDLKPFFALYLIREFNHWDVFFRLPVGSLKEFPSFPHFLTSFYIETSASLQETIRICPLRPLARWIFVPELFIGLL